MIEYLCGVDWSQSFNGLDLDNHASIDEEVQPTSALHADALEHHWHGDFLLHVKAALSQFVRQALLVHAFPQARTETTMHLNRGPDDCRGNWIPLNVHHRRSPCN